LNIETSIRRRPCSAVWSWLRGQLDGVGHDHVVGVLIVPVVELERLTMWNVGQAIGARLVAVASAGTQPCRRSRKPAVLRWSVGQARIALRRRFIGQ